MRKIYPRWRRITLGIYKLDVKFRGPDMMYSQVLRELTDSIVRPFSLSLKDHGD